MLRSFRVGNHQSIRDENELSLLPVSDRDQTVVPVAAVFGANAAGKSSLVNALRFMQSAAKLSFATWEPGAGVSRTPFRLAARSLVEPSLFVVDVLRDWVQYVYGFTVDDEKIIEEWLYTYTKRRRRVVFERTADHVDLGATTAENRAKGKVIAGMTRPNALYLSTAAQSGLDDVMPVHEWFAERMAFLPTPQQTIGATLLKRLMPGSPDRDTIVDLVRAADVGISDIRVVDAGWRDRALEAEEQAAVLRAELVGSTGRRRIELAEQIAYYDWLVALREARSLHLEFYHGSAHAPLSFEHQSEGTRAWLALVLHARAALDAGSLLVVDEIDASLHPRLTTRLIRLFQNRRTNPRGAQLVFTTHDASLLGTVVGEQVLQRDQVWFVEKDADGATTLFPLSDFQPEPDEDTQRRYLSGVFGGVPVVSEVSFRRALREKEEPSS
jgi:ABC-type molybdenum transport system ATPase subunit/photorepair protein PhrA